ncbi:MAG: hypothetical protein ACHQ0Y_04080 [Thermodesulfovibrionales bacterium]
MKKRHERILVAGNGKSGTTALYFRIKKSLPGEVSGFFEPACFEEIEKYAMPDRHIISKILLPVEGGFFERINSFFNKKILIVRDPRDIITSSLLYKGAYELVWKKTPEQISQCINLLKKKEADPSSLPVIKLLQHLHDDHDLKDYADWIAHRVSLTVQLADNPSFFIFKYEDLIAERLNSLENYLEFPLTSDTSIDEEYSRVVRTKKSGSWKDWFLEEDILFFKPLFAECIAKLDYDPDWTPNADRKILPQHSSEYFRKLVNERRTQEGLPLI